MHKSSISFLDELTITTGTKSDWPYFARWHYRSHRLGIVRFVTLLWHGEEPVGICVFAAPAASLSLRNRFFGLSGRWSRTALRALNRQLVTLSRVVLHPVYRGAGIASRFVRRSCERCGFAWVEALAEMGHINPLFEKAGFVRVGVTPRRKGSRERHSALYGGRPKRGRKAQFLTKETIEKSRCARPVYYVFDNRESAKTRAELP